jgi:hypothetical protein
LLSFWRLSRFQFCEIVETIAKMTISLIQDRIANTHQIRREALVRPDARLAAVGAKEGREVPSKINHETSRWTATAVISALHMYPY